MRIWKYTLGDYPGHVEISVPRGGKIRSVGLQNELCTMWIEVDPQAPTEQRQFEIVGTGHDTPPLIRGAPSSTVFCGTVMADPFVWHVYEVIERP